MSQTLRQRLQACLANGSKADKALASYMLAQMPSLPFETAASLAEKVSSASRPSGASAGRSATRA
jgi:DNA-binding MurR/RpiR family transcriptional regulator